MIQPKKTPKKLPKRPTTLASKNQCRPSFQALSSPILLGGLCITAAQTDAQNVNPVTLHDTVPVPTKLALGWHPDIELRVIGSDLSFDNWAEGGENAWMWEAAIDADLKFKAPNWMWSQRLKSSWGQIRSQNRPIRKSRDELFAELRIDHLWSENWSTYSAARIESQWSAGYNEKDSMRPKISEFLDPMTLSQGLGLAWGGWKGVEIRAGAAVQEIYSAAFEYANDPKTQSRENWKFTPGTELQSKIKKELYSKIVYSNEFKVFNAFETWSRTDLRLDQKLTFNWTKGLQVSLEFSQKYDYDIDPNPQARRILGLGLQWQPWAAKDTNL
jgi:hypothetical protein